MLAGRESLIRLAGKRRRNLPRHILLDHPHSQSSLPPDKFSPSSPPLPIPNAARSVPRNSLYSEKEHVLLDRGSDRSGDGCSGVGTCGGGEVNDADWVECPVCGRSIRGTNYIVNSHLDSCLSRGTKRKLTQRTLFQLKFCSRSGSKASVDLQHCTGGRQELDDRFETSPDRSQIEDGSLGPHGEKQCESESLPYSLNNGKNPNEVLVENISQLDASCKVEELPVPYSSFSSNNVNKLYKVGAEDMLSGAVLETFIVGHRFHYRDELPEGSSVHFLRDPENAKDPHAIKVLLSDAGCEQMLGYLPRELALYLSPLIDKYKLKFEGCVTSIAGHYPDFVPIKLVCEGIVPHTEMDPTDIQHLNILWENVLRVIDYGMTFPPSMTKYQQNFRVMIQEVLNHHPHLFMDDEKSFLERFDSLSDDSQRIFIRLYMRKGPWFRSSNISYSEVLDPQKAIEELQLAGYLCSFSSGGSCKSEIAEILELLTIFELREISNLLLSKKGISCTRKRELIHWLSAAFEEGTCPVLPTMVMERVGTCIKVSSAAESLLWRIQRLFFLNGEQDLSAFLLVDLGLVKYPSYTCNVSRPIFQDRKDLLAYEEAIAVAQIMDECIEETNLDMVMNCITFSDCCISSIPESSPTFLSCFSASWVYSKVITLGISVCERERRYEDAVKHLKGLLRKITYGGKRGYWTLRLSVDLEHIGCITESLTVAEEGILDPWVRAGSKMALQRRVLRLGKPPRRWKIPSFAESISRKIKEVHVRGRPLNCEMGAKNRYYGYDGSQCGVEQLALQYYAGEGGGWKGVHAESGIWMTIFGLLMWDTIFSDIPNVFQTRFQTAPLDFGTDDFYLSREELIESHLQKIRDGMAEEILISSWELHEGTACHGVNWDRHCLLDLRAIVSCIGGHCLASLCQHLAKDYRSWSSGMPDLFLWRFNGEAGDGGEVKLVEVKGPRDQLSEQQRAWMLLLMDCGFNTEVCRVSATP